MAVGDLQGADGDVQPHFLRLDIAERAGVEVARAALQRGDVLHGDAFRRAGDGAAGVGGAQDGGVRDAGAQPGIDAAGHLQDFAVAGDVEGVADAHAVRARDFAEVIAQQIDNHRVLGAVFRVAGKRRLCRFDVAGGARRAFHRQGVEVVAVAGEKEFGREAEGVPVGGMPGERRIRCGLQRAQALVEGYGIAVACGGRAQGVVDLVGVAGADEFVDGGDGAGISGAVGVKAQVEQAGGCAVVLVAQPGVDGVAV